MNSFAIPSLAHQRIEDRLAHAEARRLAKAAHPAGRDRLGLRRRSAAASADPPRSRPLVAAWS